MAIVEDSSKDKVTIVNVVITIEVVAIVIKEGTIVATLYLAIVIIIVNDYNKIDLSIILLKNLICLWQEIIYYRSLEANIKTDLINITIIGIIVTITTIITMVGEIKVSFDMKMLLPSTTSIIKVLKDLLSLLNNSKDTN